MKKKDICRNIEAKRQELAKALEIHELDLTKEEILKLSKELDYLINLYNSIKE